MFDKNSRYASIETASQSVTGPDGVLREIRYVKRRFLPPASSYTPIAEVSTSLDDRLDNLTADNISDPTRFWLICDANGAMNPFNLVDEPGRTIVIPAPQFESPL
jgi:hypothetical protein